MTKRKQTWLNVNGEINTLRRHIIQAGYRDCYETTIAKRNHCKPSEIPIEVLKEYLGYSAVFVDKPDNWHEIMYRTGTEVIESPVRVFLSMKLSLNPAAHCGYY